MTSQRNEVEEAWCTYFTFGVVRICDLTSSSRQSLTNASFNVWDIPFLFPFLSFINC